MKSSSHTHNNHYFYTTGRVWLNEEIRRHIGITDHPNCQRMERYFLLEILIITITEKNMNTVVVT